MRNTLLSLLIAMALPLGSAVAAPEEQKPETAAPPGMTLERMGDLIAAVGEEVAQPGPGQWRLGIEGVPVFVIADAAHNRMRVLVGIAKTESVPDELYKRMMQANFDTALDARYAIARGIVWGAFIHPLSELSDDLFLSGMGQAVNLARTFGKTFSSGGLTFQGGDSPGIIERELIDKLLEKGRAI